jgi:hypothetical protein
MRLDGVCPATSKYNRSKNTAINSIQCKWYQYSIMSSSTKRISVAAPSSNAYLPPNSFSISALRSSGFLVLAHLPLTVPLYALEAHEAGLLVLEPFEGGVCLCAVDLSQNK